MASSILHIKDSYYFEVPKAAWRSDRQSLGDFAEDVPFFVKNDADYRQAEAKALDGALRNTEFAAALPPSQELLESYEHWTHDHVHMGKPLDVFLETADTNEAFQELIASESAAAKWNDWKTEQKETFWNQFITDEANTWSEEKVDSYNQLLDGKILIPQPFGTLRNLYQRESGFAVSKFMVIETVVALIVATLFIRLANRMRGGNRPRGKLWNMFEAILLYFRDGVVRPAIGEKDADKFVPLLWTVFLFILGCNLSGMIPFVGSPTASFSVTIGMAGVIFVTGLYFGMKRFGFVGFFQNLVPSTGLPAAAAIPIAIVLLIIEVLGLLIKHAVLGIRLVANMVAGHIVLLAIMGLAVGAAGSAAWPAVAAISVIGSTLISMLELFVAFLQAFIFTFLSALFIGMSIHHH